MVEMRTDGREVVMTVNTTIDKAVAILNLLSGDAPAAEAIASGVTKAVEAAIEPPKQEKKTRSKTKPEPTEPAEPETVGAEPAEPETVEAELVKDPEETRKEIMRLVKKSLDDADGKPGVNRKADFKEFLGANFGVTAIGKIPVDKMDFAFDHISAMEKDFAAGKFSDYAAYAKANGLKTYDAVS